MIVHPDAVQSRREHPRTERRDALSGLSDLKGVHVMAIRIAVTPQVLVVDLGMPEMDGFELIARLRKAPNVAIRNVPAAALTH